MTIETMNSRTNEFGQSIGQPVPDWSPRSLPSRLTLKGRYCYLEPLEPERHAEDLYEAYRLAGDGHDWTYMFDGPFDSVEDYYEYAEKAARSNDPLHYAVIDCQTNKAVGTMALMRQDPTHGVVEIGSVMFSPLLQQTPLSTESHFLLMQYVFDELGYRRYEWKCDSLNAPSRTAAHRLGFTFEGIFRQAVVYKGRNRDTAWFSVTDPEWPALRRAFNSWLAAENFDDQKKQKMSLLQIRNLDNKA